MFDTGHAPQSALGGAVFDGFAAIREIGPLGMIALRCRPETAALADAVMAAVGLALPGTRGIVQDGERAVAWMAPDEWLLILPYADVAPALARIAGALAGAHHLAVDVSDARAVFSVTGPRADEIIARLCPVDLARLPSGELRRTRMAQVACALWRPGPEGITLVTFRSVARYAFDLLVNAAR